MSPTNAQAAYRIVSPIVWTWAVVSKTHDQSSEDKGALPKDCSHNVPANYATISDSLLDHHSLTRNSLFWALGIAQANT